MKGAIIFASLFAALALAAPVEDKCGCKYECPGEGDELCVCAGQAALKCLKDQKAAGLSCSEPKVPEFCKAFVQLPTEDPSSEQPTGEYVAEDIIPVESEEEPHGVEIADIEPPVVADELPIETPDIERISRREDEHVEIADINLNDITPETEYFGN